MHPTTELFQAAIAAMRERASSTEVVALYDAGVISVCEVVSAAWQACWDHPNLQTDLVRQFRAYPSEFVPELVGDLLADLAAQWATRLAGAVADAEPGAAADTGRM